MLPRKSIAEYVAEKRRACAMAEMQGGRKGISISRSRFHRKNDNAHVGQKNGSVVRELLGELRLDCRDLEADLMRLEAEWSDYRNFLRPTKMIVAKTRKPDGRGFVRRYQAGRTRDALSAGPRVRYPRRDRGKGPEGPVWATERNPALPAGRPTAEANTQAAGVLAGAESLRNVQHLTNRKTGRQLPGARPT